MVQLTNSAEATSRGQITAPRRERLHLVAWFMPGTEPHDVRCLRAVWQRPRWLGQLPWQLPSRVRIVRGCCRHVSMLPESRGCCDVTAITPFAQRKLQCQLCATG